MPGLSAGVGVLLLAVGLVGYFGTGMTSLTALIPAFFGALFLLLAAIARRGGAPRRHAMHAATAVAMMGMLGSLRGVPAFVRLLGGEPVPRPGAAVAQVLMAGLCLVFLIFAMRSFARARRS